MKRDRYTRARFHIQQAISGLEEFDPLEELKSENETEFTEASKPRPSISKHHSIQIPMLFDAGSRASFKMSRIRNESFE